MASNWSVNLVMNVFAFASCMFVDGPSRLPRRLKVGSMLTSQTHSLPLSEQPETEFYILDAIYVLVCCGQHPRITKVYD